MSAVEWSRRTVSVIVSVGPWSRPETQIPPTHRVFLSEGLSVESLSSTAKPGQMGITFFSCFLVIWGAGSVVLWKQITMKQRKRETGVTAFMFKASFILNS